MNIKRITLKPKGSHYRHLKNDIELRLEQDMIDNVSITNMNVYIYLTNGESFRIGRRMIE